MTIQTSFNTLILGTTPLPSPDRSDSISPSTSTVPLLGASIPAIFDISQRALSISPTNEELFPDFYRNIDLLPESTQPELGFGADVDTSHLVIQDNGPPSFDLPVISTSQPPVIVVSTSSSSKTNENLIPEEPLQSNPTKQKRRRIEKQETDDSRLVEALMQQNKSLKNQLREAQKREKQQNSVIAELQRATERDLNDKTYLTRRQHLNEMGQLREEYERKMDQLRQDRANLSARNVQLTRELSLLRASIQ